ncbi:Unknown protein [Striga hermonthica]|uniref:F-box domain-containing protein n=1 Tax=Striga hermonthica TaxID=68872 RepID=A0A9N7NIQ1_STRHE|nr:Unknown protein [Striga hermonthica]
MANFPSPIFCLPPPSSPPWSGEAAEAEDIVDGKKLCAQNSLLISLPDDLLLKILSNLLAQDIYYRASRVCRRFWSSCNGLILEYNFPVPSSGVLVVNPVTGGAFRLPPLPENEKFMQCCMGYAEASKAYKVALSYCDAAGRGARWAVLTVGVDSWWRNLATNQYSMEAAVRRPLVTEGFIYFFFQNTVLTLNLETEVMMEMRAPEHPKRMKQYLSTGKSLTLAIQVEEYVFQVWEMVCGDCYYYYYWRKWECQIALGTEI